MDNNAIYYLAIAIFVCYGFNLAQGLRTAINRNEKVRVVPKILCSIYCISASLIGIMILPSSYRLISYLHVFIILFQMAMIWFPKPEE
tara:strand:+ start:200 stop:463 length:264 start_codon:yes stop_codon:yes gene_type:complete